MPEQPRVVEVVDRRSPGSPVEVVSEDDGTRGSRKVRRRGATFWQALGHVIGLAVVRLTDLVSDLRYQYRRARWSSLPYSARIPIGDITQDRPEVGDDSSKGSDDAILEADDPDIEVFKDEDGALFTEHMVQTGQYIPHGRVVFACEISEAGAMRLLTRLEQMEMDATLTDNELVLKYALKRKLAGRWADQVTTEEEL